MARVKITYDKKNHRWLRNGKPVPKGYTVVWSDNKRYKLNPDGTKTEVKPLNNKSTLSKVGNWFTLAMLRTAYNDNPAVMTAAGWTPLPDGSVKLDAFNTPERNLLANNLSIIGTAPVMTLAIMSNPLAFLGSMAGGMAVDAGSVATTGRSVGENIEYATNGIIPAPIGEFANLGYWYGPKMFSTAYSQSLKLPWMQFLVGKLGHEVRNDAASRLVPNIINSADPHNPLHGLYLIRNTGVIPEVLNGMVYPSPSNRALSNNTLGEPFHTHTHYKHRPGTEYFIIDPKAYSGKTPLSILGGDTFFENSPIQLKYLTIVTGNPKLIALAKERGFKVITSDALQQEYENVMNEPVSGINHLGFNLSKGDMADRSWANYNKIATDLIHENFGKLTLELLDALEYTTNLKSNFDKGLQFPTKSAREHVLAKKYEFPLHPGRESLSHVKYTLIAEEEGAKPLVFLEESVTPEVRTRIGDVEINDPALFYRQGDEAMGLDFLTKGFVDGGENSISPMFKAGGLWYGLSDVFPRPIKDSEIRFHLGGPKTDLLVSTGEMLKANSSGGALLAQGFASDLETKITRDVSRETTRRVPLLLNESANSSNTLLFRFVPGYGFRLVRPESTLLWNKALNMVDDIQFETLFNEFANKYGYDPLPKGVSRQEAENLAKEMLNRHNSYYRGTSINTASPEDIQQVTAILGHTPSTEEFERYAATHGRVLSDGTTAPLFISPTTNAFIYGSGKAALVRRPFTLGSNRMNWFKEGDFLIMPRTSTPVSGSPGDIVAPWKSAGDNGPLQYQNALNKSVIAPRMTYNNELLYFDDGLPLLFVKWVDTPLASEVSANTGPWTPYKINAFTDSPTPVFGWGDYISN